MVEVLLATTARIPRQPPGATAPNDLLLGWWIGQGFELGLASGVPGTARAGASLGRIWMKVGIAVAVLFAVVVTLQTLGRGGASAVTLASCVSER